MTESQFTVVRLAGFVGTAGIALGLQRFLPYAARRGSWRVNGALWLLNAAVLTGVCGACACSVAQWASTAGIGFLNLVRLPLPVKMLVTAVGLDFVSYLWHRANHRVPILWRFHRVHHSDMDFTVSTGLRFHPGELLLSLPLRLAAVAAIGAPAAGVVAFEVIFNLANLVEHGNTSLPVRIEQRLAFMFVTPALHRRHHTRRRPELDSNFGTILTFWDRLFRTYGASSSAMRIETGAPGIDQPLSFTSALTLPFDHPWSQT